MILINKDRNCYAPSVSYADTFLGEEGLVVG